MLSDLPKHSIAPAAPSPGMSAQHYAPAAEALAFEARQLPAVAQWLAEHPERFTLLLALHNAPHLHPVKSERHEILALPSDPDGYARALYAALHAADARQFQTVLVQLPPDTPPWHAVRDRLLRATRPIIPSPGDAGA